MSIVISGSLAYDYIMDFPDSFKNHILPEQIHILNVCFVVDKMQKNFGGCAGNMGYTMNLLGASPIIFSPLGSDSADYFNWLKKCGLKTEYVPIVSDKMTSAAYITTDKDDNQIIAYYNGVADKAIELNISDVKEKIDLVLITPTKKEAMIKHAKECYDKKIPFVFDPSHQLTAFTPQELMATIGQASFYIANDYEMKLTEEKTGMTAKDMLDHMEAVIITLGERGSMVVTKEGVVEVGVCTPDSVEDPTGAGDAYRAGFFTAYTSGNAWKACAQAGAVASTYAIEHYGTQNHTFTKAEFLARYKEAFGEDLALNP